MKKRQGILLILLAALVCVLAFSACSGEVLEKDNTYPADYGEWIVTAAATCDAEGVETRVSLSDPSKSETRAIASNGHEWEEWTVKTQPDLRSGRSRDKSVQT